MRKPCVHAKSLQSCPTLCHPMNCSLPNSSVHRILQARILEWSAMPSSRGSSKPRDRTGVSYISCIGRRVLYHSCHLGSPKNGCAHAQSRQPFCDPMDCSPPGSSIHGIFQARILEWVAYSRGSSWPRDWTHVSCCFCIGRWVLYHWATWEALCKTLTKQKMEGLYSWLWKTLGCLTSRVGNIPECTEQLTKLNKRNSRISVFNFILTF